MARVYGMGLWPHLSYFRPNALVCTLVCVIQFIVSLTACADIVLCFRFVLFNVLVLPTVQLSGWVSGTCFWPDLAWCSCCAACSIGSISQTQKTAQHPKCY